MQKESRPYKLWITTCDTDSAKFAKAAAAEGAETVVAVGGDGTVNEVINGIYGSGAYLGIISAGSGNDLVFTLRNADKPYGEESVESDIYTILNGTGHFIDLIKMNDQYLVNCGSVGLDADIAADAARIKHRYGRYSYVVSALKKTITYKTKTIKLTVDGDVIEQPLFLVSANGGKRYGGSFNIAPSAKLDDGLITLCYIKKMLKLKMVYAFPMVLFGKHENLKAVGTHQCREVTFEFSGEKRVNLDGNIVMLTSPLRFSVIPNAVKVLM